MSAATRLRAVDDVVLEAPTVAVKRERGHDTTFELEFTDPEVAAKLGFESRISGVLISPRHALVTFRTNSRPLVRIAIGAGIPAGEVYTHLSADPLPLHFQENVRFEDAASLVLSITLVKKVAA